MRYYKQYDMADLILTWVVISAMVIMTLLLGLGTWKLYELLQIWWIVS